MTFPSNTSLLRKSPLRSNFFAMLCGDTLSSSANTTSRPIIPTCALVRFISTCAILSRLNGHCPICFKLFSSISTITTLLDVGISPRRVKKCSRSLLSKLFVIAGKLK